MRFKLWVAFGTLLAAASGAQAQQRAPSANPADPSVPVPPIAYASALADYAPAPKNGAAAPDKSWRPANDALAGTPAHAGHHSPAPAPAPGRGPAAPRRAGPGDPAGDHHKQH